MSTETPNVFKKENLDRYLKELAKEYKKLAGKNLPAEIILIGGAAIIENYGFRDMTADIDAVIRGASAMKDAINRVGDRFALPNGWLNADFRKTASYSDKLFEHSSFYKTFYQILNVRVVTGEYLIAMKLRAFRQYRNDVSDVIGILAEHKKRKDPITFARIDKAVTDLYGSWDDFSSDAVAFIKKTLSDGNYQKIYDLVLQNEKDARELLIDFQKENPAGLKEENTAEILSRLRAEKQRTDKKTP